MINELIKNEILNCFVPIIQSWEVDDIYAISFFVYDNEDNPCNPTVSLSYNTEQEVKNNLKYADEQEVRWNYAYWPQNVVADYGYDKSSSKLIKKWVVENKFHYKEHYNPYDTTKEIINTLLEITTAFVQILMDVVIDIHSSGLLKHKFNREIPIIIHELEYYDVIAKQNIEANGYELVKDFTDYINSMYELNKDFRL